MINLTQIRGIGVATEAKLVATGYSSVEELAKASADKVSQQTSISAKQANRIIAAAKNLINSRLLDNKTTDTKPKNFKKSVARANDKTTGSFSHLVKLHRKMAKDTLSQKKYKKFRNAEKRYLKQLKQLKQLN